MNRNKLMLVLAAVAAVAIIAGGLLLGVHPQLAQAAADRAQRSQIDKANDVNRAELARLAKEQQQLPTLKSDLAALRASVPSTPDTAAFIRELNEVAKTTGVTVSNIATGDPIAYTPPMSTAATSDAEATAPASSSPAPTASAAPSPATPQAPAAVTDPQITSANFSTIQMSVAVTGSYDQALAFTSGLQHGPRLFLVNSIASGGGSGSGDDADATPTWTLSGLIYVLSNTAAPAPANG
jgi:Tfp pilus assembly protein PilO